MNAPPPVVLTIAGSDSSAGAGIQADLKTFAAHGVYGVCAVTALVAEVPGAVTRVHAVDPILLESQLNTVGDAFPLSCIKTGMLANAALVERVADFAGRHPGLPLVVDPVIRAGAGAVLLDETGVETMKRDLLPRARLVTPNLPEAERILGLEIRTRADFAEAPRRLHEQYGCDVLVKGGHFSGDSAETSAEISDHAWIGGRALVFSRPRLDAPDVHGTGCTLAAAIAARLARGDTLEAAIAGATRYLAACLVQRHAWGNSRSGGSRSGGSRDGIEALNHFPAGLDCAHP